MRAPKGPREISRKGGLLDDSISVVNVNIVHLGHFLLNAKFLHSFIFLSLSFS